MAKRKKEGSSKSAAVDPVNESQQQRLERLERENERLRRESPRIHRDLRARGVRISRKRVERLMREKGLKGAQKRRFRCTTDSRHTLPIAPNELDRNFDPSQPNRVWAGDVSAPQQAA